jgi:magnesium-transporting ATPase (P-type)
MKEYKVLTQKDKWFSGKFDPEKLEQAINAYAEQGWRVISCATADIPGFGTARQAWRDRRLIVER